MRSVSTAAAATALVGVVALWLALEYKPGWYRPVVLDEATLRRARIESVGLADRISERLVHRLPVDVTLTDRTINEWLAALPELWPNAGDGLPPELSQPAVRFDAGTVHLGAHYANGGWRAILGLALSIDVSLDGRSLEVRLHGAASGALPAPRSVLDRIIDPLLDRGRRRNGPRGVGENGWGAALRNVRSTDDLFQGVSIGNRFVWFNGHRPFRIATIDVGDRKLRLRLEPL